MISDLVQENEALIAENEELKRRLVAINEGKIGFNEQGFDYDSLIELQEMVNDMLDSVDIINGVTINVDDLLNDFRDSTYMPYRFNLPIKVNSIGDKMKNKLYLVTVKDLETPTMEVKMRYCVETDNVNKIKDYFKHENRKIVSIEEDLRAKQKGQYLYID